MADKSKKKPWEEDWGDIAEVEKSAPAPKESPSFMTKEGLKEGLLKSIPIATSAGMGLLGSGLGPAGTLAGVGMGGAAGKYIEDAIRTQLLEQKGEENLHTKALQEAAGSVVGEGVGGLLAKGLGGAGKYLSEYLGSAKPNAGAITQAAKKIGAPTTPGLLSDSELVQGIESSLIQSPTLAGKALGKKTKGIDKAMNEASELVLQKGAKEGIPLSQYETGLEAQGLLKSEIDEKLAPAREFYKSYSSEVTPFVSSSAKSKTAVARNIRNLDLANAIKGSPEQGFANQIADSIESSNNLDQVRKIKTYVGNVISEAERSGNGNMVATAGEIYGKLQRLEQRSLTRGTIEAMASEKKGAKVATQIIGDLKKANSAYRTIMTDLKDLSKEAGLGKVRGPDLFTKQMQSMPPEQMANKFFNVKNFRQIKDLKEKFPKTYEALERAQLANIWKSSLDAKGNISTNKMLNKVRSLGPEVRTQLFGNDDVLTSLEIMNAAKYPKMGPSGTPQGIEYMNANILNPLTWVNEVVRAGQSAVIQNPGITKTVGKSLSSAADVASSVVAPQLTKGALQGLLNSERPLKKEEKLPWEEDYE